MEKQGGERAEYAEWDEAEGEGGGLANQSFLGHPGQPGTLEAVQTRSRLTSQGRLTSQVDSVLSVGKTRVRPGAVDPWAEEPDQGGFTTWSRPARKRGTRY